MQQITLTLPMIPDMELTASKTAGALGEHIGMSRDKIDEVQMAVVEACINAFEHSRAESQEVHMRLIVLGDDTDPRGLQITIRDHGQGFEAVEVLHSDKEVAEMQKRGHGLRIIHGLMDEVDISSDAGGTIVTMKKLR